MQVELPKEPQGPGGSHQPLAATPSFVSQPSNRPTSESDPENSPRNLDNLGLLGSPPMSSGPLLSENPQMHRNQQTPDHLPGLEFPQTNYCPPTDDYATTLGHLTHNNPPTQGGHPTQLNRSSRQQIPLTGNPDHGEPGKDRQSPNARLPATPHMHHTTPSTYSPARPPPNPLTDNQEKEVIIAVMGVTGTGKSYFIREVSGISDVEVSSRLHSCTTEVQSYSFRYGTVKVTLVDTPGFNDTTRSDTEVLTNICTWMSSSYEEGKLLSGIIYLHRITDVRMDGASLKNIKMFQRMCGPDALQNAFLTTTQWSNVNLELGEEREGNLRHEDFWAELLSQGACLERFMGTRESGLELISKLMGREPKPLRIQDQMVEKKMTLAETDVGKFMNAELISQQKKYEEDLKALERERQNAIKEKDDEMVGIIAQEELIARQKLEEAAAEMKLLTDLHEAQMEKLKEVVRKRDEEREREDRAVIAVALDDTSIMERIITVFTPYSTKGRLIYNTNDMREFEKAPFEITIHYYQLNASFFHDALAKARAEFTDKGVHTSNYIVYNNAHYLPKPGGPVRKGAQKFQIFTKHRP